MTDAIFNGAVKQAMNSRSVQPKQAKAGTSPEQQLKAYLDALERPMAPLGDEAKQEWRAEAAAHLLSLIAAYEELGDSPEAAVAAALEKFSQAPETTGRQVRQAAQSAAPDPTAMRAAARGVMEMASAAITGLTLVSVPTAVYIRSGEPVALTLVQLVSAVAFVTVPLWGGWRAGRRVAMGRAAAARGIVANGKRSRIDRAPMPRWLRERCPDADFAPWVVLGAIAILVFGGVLASLTTSALGMKPFDLAGGMLWVPMTALAAAAGMAWSERRSRSGSAPGDVREGDAACG